MTDAGATIIVGLIGTIVSVAAAVFSYHYAKISSQTLARQMVIGADLKQLSALTYEIVAFSVEAANSKSDARFGSKLAAAIAIAKKLDRIRLEHRYSMPFIIDPIWHLKGLPNYVSHYRHDRENDGLRAILESATKLRKQLDLAMVDLFFEGRHPTVWRRWRLRCASRILTRDFKKGAPTLA